MFPKHCKEVSIKKVDFPLTAEDIKKNLHNKQAYRKTEFIILNREEDWAVVSIRKGEAKTLFSRIEEVDIISLPDSTKYVEDQHINVLSPSKMVEKAEELKAETLIVKGKFEHVSFIHNEIPNDVYVFEVVPPVPPKLVELAEKALDSGSVNKPVKIVPQTLDLRDLAKKSTKNKIVFPCQASGLKDEKDSYYLDQRPEISDDELGDISLVGCDLSLRIFKTIYGVEPEFFNFCPKKMAMEGQAKGLVLTKCCEVKEGHELIGKIAVVPWGATQEEVEEALNNLLGIY